MGCGRERGGLLTLSASSGCSKSIPARKSCADCLGGAGCEVLALSDFRDGGGRERRCVIAIVWVCQLLHDVGMRGRDGGGRRRGGGGRLFASPVYACREEGEREMEGRNEDVRE